MNTDTEVKKVMISFEYNSRYQGNGSWIVEVLNNGEWEYTFYDGTPTHTLTYHYALFVASQIAKNLEAKLLIYTKSGKLRKQFVKHWFSEAETSQAYHSEHSNASRPID